MPVAELKRNDNQESYITYKFGPKSSGKENSVHTLFIPHTVIYWIGSTGLSTSKYLKSPKSWQEQMMSLRGFKLHILTLWFRSNILANGRVSNQVDPNTLHQRGIWGLLFTWVKEWRYDRTYHQREPVNQVNGMRFISTLGHG